MVKDQITYEDFDKVDIRRPFVSQVLTLGIDDGTEDQSNWIVLSPIKDVPLGRRVK